MKRDEDGSQTVFLKRSERSPTSLEGKFVIGLVYQGMGKEGLRLSRVAYLKTENEQFEFGFLGDLKWYDLEGKSFEGQIEFALGDAPFKPETKVRCTGFVMRPDELGKWYAYAGKRAPSEPRFDVFEMRAVP